MTGITTADQVTGTATFRRLVGGLAICILCVGCGATGHARSPGRHGHTASTPSGASGGATAPSSPGGGFAWFAAAPPPAGWRLARIPAGAVLPYPASWRLLSGDAGTATVALRTSRGKYVGYLNLTPRQGEETLSNWRSFRVEHNREEGDRQVKELAVATSLRFRAGQGNCVKDSYVSSTGNPYVEIACLIAGPKASVVAVGAAPPSAWASQRKVIERAIEGVEA